MIKLSSIANIETIEIVLPFIHTIFYLYINEYKYRLWCKNNLQNFIKHPFYSQLPGKVSHRDKDEDGWCRCICNVEQLNQKMIKLPLTSQKKQKILNYEIKLIQQCSDSLFNSSNCSHQRYLQWNLYQTLRSIIQNQPYQIRWMGNDHHSYIYTYFYITITACSKHTTSMVELKSVLYDLAQKYLSQYEQKLLIEFLCLIEYSQEKYLFFRKYAKVQIILVKLFQQIQHRNHQLPYRSPRSSIEEDNTFSKLTTCITSPCKSLEKQQDPKYNQRSAQKINNSSFKKQNQRKNKRRFVAMFDLYCKYFKFVNIEYLFENIIRFTISFERVNDSSIYYVCIEKGCFFVVQVGGQLAISSNISKKSCSIIEEEKQYIQQILSNQKTRSKIKNNSIEYQGNKQTHHEHEFTPKFISNKKKSSFADQDFYNELVTNKNVNIEVLQVQDFDEKQQSLQQSRNAILHYKKKIQNLNNINNTIKSIDLDKPNTRQNIPFRYDVPKVKTEYMPFQQYFNYKKTSQKIQNNPFSKNFMKNSEKNVNKHPSFVGTNRTALNVFKGALKVNPQNISKTIKQNNTFSRETMLSASNLKRFNKQIKPFIIQKQLLPPRQFHSHSPRNRLIEARPPSYYNPLASPLKPRFALRSKENKIKFTYL